MGSPKAPLGPCEHCERPISERRGGTRGRPPKFCSVGCKEAAHNAIKRTATLNRRSDRTCVQCAKPIPPTMSGKALCCSPACSTKYQNAKRAAAKKAANLAKRGPCLGCGQPIPDTVRSHATYCSRDCMRRTVRARNYNSDRARDLNRRYLYGISRQDFDMLLASQGGVCAICGTSDWPGKDNRPHVDHCHESGAIRGILCNNCNQGLGHFRDDPERLRRAAEYLEEAAL